MMLAIFWLQTQVWSLEECIDKALNCNPALKQQEATLRQRRNDATLMLADWLPAVSIRAKSGFSWGRSVDMQELMIIDNRMNYTTTLSAGVSYSLSDKAARHYDRKAAMLSASSAEAGLAKMQTELMAEVTAACLQLLLDEEELDAAECDLEDISSKYAEKLTRLGAGMATEAELTSIKAQLAAEKATLAELTGKCARARMTLTNLLNLASGENFEILPPTGDSIPPLPEYHCLDSDTDAVREAEAAIGSSRMALKAARLSILPDISISGGYGTYYGNTGNAGIVDQLSSNGNPSLGFRLEIPLISGSAALRKVGEARCAEMKNRLELDKVRNEMRRKACSDSMDTVILHGNCIAAGEELAAADEALAVAERKYGQGILAWPEYLAARNARQKARSRYIQARYKYRMQLKLMEYRYGTEDMCR